MDKRQTEDPRQKGDIAEKLFELECLKRNIPIYAPVNSATRDDYVIVIDDEFKKVQVKYVSEYNGKISVSFTKNQNGRSGDKSILKYTEDEIDLFFVYNPDRDEWYNIPMSISSNARCICLRTEPTKNNQSSGVNWTKDYIW